jgi:hypothetical protein
MQKDTDSAKALTTKNEEVTHWLGVQPVELAKPPCAYLIITIPRRGKFAVPEFLKEMEDVKNMNPPESPGDKTFLEILDDLAKMETDNGNV